MGGGTWDWQFTFEEVLPRLLDVVHVTILATLLGFRWRPAWACSSRSGG